MTEERRWIVRLSAAAEADYQNITAWTMEQFGDLQARIEISNSRSRRRFRTVTFVVVITRCLEAKV